MADFKTLTRFTEAYNTKRGKEFQADLQGFIGKDAEVATAGQSWVVRTFANVSGVTDEINKRLDVEIVESEQYHNFAANLSVFTRTEAEALALQKLWTKGKRISAPVRVSSHEYDGKSFIDLVVATASVFESATASTESEDSNLPI